MDEFLEVPAISIGDVRLAQNGRSDSRRMRIVWTQASKTQTLAHILPMPLQVLLPVRVAFVASK